MGTVMIFTGVVTLDGDTHTITATPTTVMATHTMDITITMVATMGMRNNLKTTMVLEELWDLKQEPVEHTPIEVQ